MQLFDELGRLVEQRWRNKNYNEAVFPEIAEQTLLELNVRERVDAWEIMRCLHTGMDLPGQRGDSFSDLPVTLYAGPRFVIDVYFWLDGTTSIHQHSFSGAFQVLLGSSLHSLYTFKPEQEINEHFSAGQVRLREVQVLESGDVRKILPGRQFIHSLFHLDRPSATITIRTHQTPSALPQHNYLKPYLAHNPFFKEQSALKKARSVILLLRMKHPEAHTFISELIASSDFQTAFMVITAAFEALVDNNRGAASQLKDGEEKPDVLQDDWECFHQLLETAHRRHGNLVNLLPAVLGEMQREKALIDLRGRMTDSEHRFFLALLLNVPHRQLVLDLLKQRFPHREPIDIVCGWVDEFSHMKSAGSSEQNVLGMTRFSDAHQLILRHLLDGLSPDQIKHVFKKDYSGTNAESHADFDQLYRSLQSSVLLKSLLFGSPSALDNECRIEARATG
jgi:hypothetical protein